MTTALGSHWQRRDWLVVLAYLAVAHAIFYPALRPGVFLYGRDTLFHDYGMLLYGWSQLLDHGLLALWNPYLFCGLPSLGAFAFCPFYPVTWLFAALPFSPAFTYQYILNDWLAGVWTYWAARRMGLGRKGALLAGLVFMVSGHLVTLAHAGHLQKLAAIAWMPFVFGCATAAMAAQFRVSSFEFRVSSFRFPVSGFRYWVAGGVGVGLQLLAAHVQIAYYTLLFVALWVVWLAVWGLKSPDRFSVSSSESRVSSGISPLASCLSPLFSGAVGLLVTIGVAGAISAAQVLPALEITPFSNRGRGVAFEQAAETSYPPFEFIEFLLPSFLGDNAGSRVPYWGRWGERIVTDYMGLLPLVLAGFGLVAARRPDRWFWLAVILVAAVLAAGGYTPVFRLAWRFLPGLDHFRSPATIMVFVAWPLALLAGSGLEAFEQRTRDDVRRSRYLVALLAAAVAAGVVFLLLTVRAGQWPWAQLLGGAIPREPASRAATIYAGLQRSALFAMLACVALTLFAAASGRKPTARDTAKIPMLPSIALAVLFVLAVVDPRLHHARYIKAAPEKPFRLHLSYHWSDSILHTLPPPVRGIETDNEYTNRMMTRRIASLHGYHPVHLQNYLDLLDLYAQNHPALGRLVFEQFILAPPGKPPGREYERRAADSGQVLWLRRPPILYAYFPQRVEIASDTKALLAAMSRPDFDPYRCSIALDAGLAYRESQGATASARVVHYSPNRIDLATSSTETRPMVVAELAAPGWFWVARSGEPQPPATVNYAFRAVRVPSGEHRVGLVYRPFSFRLGLYVTLLTLIVLLAVGWASWPWSLRRGAPGNCRISGEAEQLERFETDDGFAGEHFAEDREVGQAQSLGDGLVDFGANAVVGHGGEGLQRFAGQSVVGGGEMVDLLGRQSLQINHQ